jgi:hypothetical protein
MSDNLPDNPTRRSEKMGFSKHHVVPGMMLILLLVCAATLHAAELKTKNVLVVMTDGLRWQEVFTGAEDSVALDNKMNTETIQKLYRQATPEARREALLPFMWGTVARQGQIYGNRAKGSTAQVTNGLKFSYPGYNETLTGAPDARINTNDAVYNPNQTVFEWVNSLPEFKGKVAAFGAWDRFEHIFNAPRCGFPVNWGFEPLKAGKTNEKIELLNRLKAEMPRHWWAEPYDAITYHTAFEYLKENKPRAFYLSLGETDEWAHEGNYWEYLVAARRYDAYLKELWDTVQALPEYKDQTTLIMLADHGRGDGPRWRDHNKDVPNAEYMWIAVIGPDTPALGERENIPAVTQNQVAATMAALLGLDYNAVDPKAGKPLADVLPKKTK